MPSTKLHQKLLQPIHEFPFLEPVEAAGGQALPCLVDVRNEDQIQKSIEDAVSKFGGIDILVSNAGTAPSGRIGEVSDDVLRKTFEVN